MQCHVTFCILTIGYVAVLHIVREVLTRFLIVTLTHRGKLSLSWLLHWMHRCLWPLSGSFVSVGAFGSMLAAKVSLWVSSAAVRVKVIWPSGPTFRVYSNCTLTLLRLKD